MFDFSKYITTDSSEIKFIKDYALSRKIIKNYLPCYFFSTSDGESWIRNLAIGFIHVDHNLMPIGLKFRVAESPSIRVKYKSDNLDNRFSARGKLGCYIAGEYIINDNPVLFTCESETSANSLFEYLKSINVSCVVISYGSVSSYRNSIPEKYDGILNRKVIIDYDGNEQLYEERIEKYKEAGIPVKLKLPKGEDINSLFLKNKLYLFKNQLLHDKDN